MFGLFTRTPPPQTLRSLSERAGCFGKLPIHGDFIRHNVLGADMAAFETWVREGVNLITRKHPGAWPEVYRSFPPVNFILAGRPQERTLAGVLSAGRDRSGRPYPFAVLVATEDHLVEDLQALVPHIYRNYLAEATAICQARWTQEPLSLLTGRIDRICRRDSGLTRRQLLDSQIEPLKTTRLGSFWEALGGASTAPARETLFNALYSALKTVALREPARIPWGLRLPLPSVGESGTWVMFWLQMIDAVLAGHHWRAHYFWNGAGPLHPPRLTVFFRPLPGSFLPQLLNPEVNDGSILDLCRECARVAEDRCSPALRQLLARDETSMLEVLYQAGRREVLQ